MRNVSSFIEFKTWCYFVLFGVGMPFAYKIVFPVWSISGMVVLVWPVTTANIREKENEGYQD